MSETAVRVPAPAATFADLVWPVRAAGAAGVARAVVLAILGACLLTISAKVQVPGPVPMTLQTLAVMALGALLGMRLAVASVALYLVQGLLGMPVFATTPPLVPGLAYFMGPTGGFLVGMLGSAALVGLAADRGLMRQPLSFAFILLAADTLVFVSGFLWLAFAAQTATGVAGLGATRAFAAGVQPFLLGEALKLALAAAAIPAVFETLSRLVRRG